jgi:hypothetical protein
MIPMKSLLTSLVLILGCATRAIAGDQEDFAAVRQADEQRIAATIAGDSEKLSALLSEHLRYSNSDGRVQTKAQFIEAAARSKIKYLSVQRHNVEATPIALGAVTLSGDAHVIVTSSGQRIEFDVHFLSVWRQESGKWRLLAYQSSSLPQAAAKGAR